MLTSEGYKKIGTLDGQEVDLINKDGDVSRGKVWYAGDKETVIMKRVGAPNIECTPDHVFMDNQGNEVEAKDMKGKRLMPYLNAPNHDNRLLVKLGFLQGDGTLSTRTIVANIGQDDDDVLAYFNLTREDAQKSSSVVFNVSEYTDAVETYGIKRVPLIYRTLPEGISKWSDEDKEAFLCGLYSANGSVIGGQGRGRVTLKSVNLELIHGVKDLLEDLGIESYITTNKETDIGFSNGTYTCRESYDLNIGNWEEKQKFFNTIGFIHKYKTDKLREFLTDLSPMVQWVVKGTLQPVYDFSEPITHWGVTEGAIAHNCAEILLDDKQVCNLSVVNVSAFADDNGICDYKGLGRAQTLSARAGYRMTLPDLELKEWDIKQKEHRLTGCSLTGWLDFVEKAEIDIEEQTRLLDVLRENAHEANKAIAEEHNLNESTNVTATKPDGSMSLVFGGVSAGVHASHSPYYIRRIRISASDPLVKVCDDLGWTIKNEVGQTDENVNTKVIEFPVRSSVKRTKDSFSAIEQLEIYKMFQEHYTDQNTSITVTVKEDEWDDVEEWMWNNWDSYVGISFLPSDGGFYQLMPYEEITEEEYAVAKKGMKPFNPNLLKKYEGSLQEYESIEAEQETDPECVNGVCPIR